MRARSATCSCTSAPPPASRASAAVAATRAASRPTRASSAPRRASSTAAAWPTPRVAPVSTTTGDMWRLSQAPGARRTRSPPTWRRWSTGTGSPRRARARPDRGYEPGPGVPRVWDTASMHAAAVGFGLGFVVALQLGPMSLLLIRSTLRGGWRVGLAIGAGIAVVDGLYAAAGAAGVAPLLAVGPVRLVLGLVGATVLLVIGARTLYSAFRVRHGGEVRAEVATPRRAFATSLAGTASNPLTIASWAAIFAAASAAGAADTSADAVLLVAGVGLGSLAWGSVLAGGTSVARRAIGERAMQAADTLAGLGLIAFGGALAVGATKDT